MHTVGARLVAWVAAAVLLSGCGGSPEPGPVADPTKSASPSASASAVPTAPVMPAAAKKKTDAAVEAFARHYVKVINYATQTGVRNDLDSLADAKCASCRRISARLKQIYSAGGYVRSNGWRVTGADVVENQPLSRKYIDLTITQSPQVVVEEAGSKSEKFLGGKQSLTMLLAWRTQGWVVTRMTLAGTA